MDCKNTHGPLFVFFTPFGQRCQGVKVVGGGGVPKGLLHKLEVSHPQQLKIFENSKIDFFWYCDHSQGSNSHVEHVVGLLFVFFTLDWLEGRGWG